MVERRAEGVVLVIVESYLALTLIGYLAGPLARPKNNTLAVVSLVALYQIVFALGSLLPRWLQGRRDASAISKSRPPTHQVQRRNFLGKDAVFWVVLGGGLLSALFSVLSIGKTVGSFNLTELWGAVQAIFTDPASLYVKNRDATVVAGSPLTAVSVAMAPFYYCALPVGLYYFGGLSTLLRGVVILDGTLQVVTSAIRGMNFGVFRVIIVVITIVALILVKRRGKHSGTRSKWRLLWLGCFVLVPLAFIWYFVMNTSDRLSTALPLTIAGVPMNYDNVLVSSLPDTWKVGAVLVFLYLCQGYYGFSYTFDYPFESTYGFGSGRFVSDNVGSMLGTDIYSRTYVHRMSGIWDERQNWHTAYTWFANDVSPVGVVLVMLFVGLMFGMVLRGALRGEVLAIALLPLYCLMVVFIPANNVVISNPLTCMPFVILSAVFFAKSRATKRCWVWLSRGLVRWNGFRS